MDRSLETLTKNTRSVLFLQYKEQEQEGMKEPAVDGTTFY